MRSNNVESPVPVFGQLINPNLAPTLLSLMSCTWNCIFTP